MKKLKKPSSNTKIYDQVYTNQNNICDIIERLEKLEGSKKDTKVVVEKPAKAVVETKLIEKPAKGKAKGKK